MRVEVSHKNYAVCAITNLCCQSAYSCLRGYTKKEFVHDALYISAGSGKENKVFVLVFIKKTKKVHIFSAMHNSQMFDHTFELLLPVAWARCGC